MAAIAGHELTQDGLELAARIAEETDGNPFFVGEILSGLRESGALAFDEHKRRWRIDASELALPESVREVIERRVERLGEESLEALRLAAVIGREFDLELLSAIVEIDETRLLDRLEGAVAALVLAESSEQVGRFRFAHALINQTLYDGLGATRRARMHERVARALEERYGADPAEHLAELALHWRLAAASVDKAKAADYAMRAGEQALENLAPAEAVKLFADAVELTGGADSRERCEALIGLGDAQRQTGAAAYRETLLEASRIASDLADAELAARSAVANNRGFYGAFGQVDNERLAAIERAIELDEPPNPARRAGLLALQAQELTWDRDFARRRTLAEEAIGLARDAGNKRVLVEVLRGAFFAVWSARTLGVRTALAEELAPIADELRDPALRRAAQNFQVNVCVERGELTGAQAALGLMQGSAAELGQPYVNWVVAFATAGLTLVHGDLSAGERLAERAFELGQQAEQPEAVTFYGIQLFYVRTFQGRGEEIIALVEQSVQANPAVPALRAGLASTLCWLDRRGEAATILEEAASDRFEHVLPASDELSALVLYADAAAQTGDRRVAAILYDLIQPWADQVDWNGLTGYGHARLYLGLLASVVGDHERADEHLALACEFHEANDMPLWAARGQLGWAEALAARGDADGARGHATRALELSRQHSYGAVEPRAEALVEAESAAGT
jgi:hypothetical protein